MNPRRGIFQKGLLLVSIPLLFQLVALLVVGQMVRESRRAQATANRSREILAVARQLVQELVDAETGIRGFLLSNDSSFLAPYLRASSDVPRTLNELERLTQEGGEPAGLGSLVPMTNQLMDVYSQFAELGRTGRPAEAIAMVRAKEGLNRMNSVREQVDQLIAREEEVNRTRETQRLSAQRLTMWALGGAAAVAVLSSLVALAMFSRHFTRRLAVLTTNVRRLGRSEELEEPIPGDDEIVDLDLAFRAMAQELSQSREELLAQAELLKSILDSIGDGVVVADAQGKFLHFNPAARRLAGRGPEDVGPEEWSKLYNVFLPDGVTPFPTDQLPLLLAMRGESVTQSEMIMRNGDQQAYLSVTARPIGNADNPNGGVAIFRDITNRKRTEWMLRHHNEELERRILERTAELSQTNRELSRKNEENEMFVYSVSHDLRSPLVNLQGFTRELAEGCAEIRKLLDNPEVPPAIQEQARQWLDGDMAESMRFIQTGVLRLSQIIDALLRLSRAGRVEYRPARVDANQVIRRVIDSLRSTIDRAGAQVHAEPIAALWVDATSFDQVIANLVENSLKYLEPSRPGVIEIGQVDGEEDPGVVTLFVRDNGRGVSETYRSKLFHPFQRFHPDVAEGTGMGLAIVRRLVERNRGRIWMDFSGVGTTVFLSFPKAPDEIVAEKAGAELVEAAAP